MMSFRAKFTPRSNIFKEYFWIWIKIFFINPKTRNIVILDDLMLSASKDSRIDELFTNDSRHRSLSVIATLFLNFDSGEQIFYIYFVLELADLAKVDSNKKI